MPETARTTVMRGAALFLVLFFALAAPLAGLAQATPAPERLDTYDKAHPENLNEDDLAGRAAVVMDADTGTVLFQKNANRKTYPASTTKIMTCLLALENCKLDEIVVIPAEATKIPLDSSKLGVTVGDEYRMIDLLYGMMMKSGNDASVAVAMHVAGSEAKFAEMMNARAKEIGAKNTNFVNSHGYHDEAHVSTAYDMALIGREAMKNRTFREIVAAKNYVMGPTKLFDKKRLETTNRMFVASTPYYYPDLVGIKTGYHSKAGQCFVGAANKNGVLLISCVLKSTNDGKWADTIRLMDYGTTRYNRLTFAELYARAPRYAAIAGAARTDENAGLVMLDIVPGTELDHYQVSCLPEQESVLLNKLTDTMEVKYTRELEAPIQAGDILGTLTLELDGKPITATVVASRDVALEPQPFSLDSLFPELSEHIDGSMIILIGLGAGALVITIVSVRVHIALKNRRRRREMMRRRRAAYDRYRIDG